MLAKRCACCDAPDHKLSKAAFKQTVPRQGPQEASGQQAAHAQNLACDPDAGAMAALALCKLIMEY